MFEVNIKEGIIKDYDGREGVIKEIKDDCNNTYMFLEKDTEYDNVKVGDEVVKGQHIANVGPKNVYGVKGNTYKDAQGNPTNGATTGCHMHLGVRVNGNYINPLELF